MDWKWEAVDMVDDCVDAMGLYGVVWLCMWEMRRRPGLLGGGRWTRSLIEVEWWEEAGVVTGQWSERMELNGFLCVCRPSSQVTRRGRKCYVCSM